jgi:murein DD-endopeptidase MepM/ murein hydrolase activator NlpD
MPNQPLGYCAIAVQLVGSMTLGLWIGPGFLDAQATPLEVEIRSRALAQGEVVEVVVRPAGPVASVSVSLDARSVAAHPVDAGAWSALVGLDLERAAGPAALVVTARRPDGSAVLERRTLAVSAKAFPTRRLTVDNAFVNPPASARPRIEQDARALEAVWASGAPERAWRAPFRAPVAESPTSAFGTRSIYNGQARSPHAGADFPSPAGTPVHAPSHGRVGLARNLYYSGGTVIIDHGAGLFSTFAHLSRLDVQAGGTVAAGAVIGRVGATGRVTGAHLHWAVRVSGARVDPMSLLSVLGR